MNPVRFEPVKTRYLFGLKLDPDGIIETRTVYGFNLVPCIGIAKLVQLPVKNLPRFNTLLSESIEARTIIGSNLDPFMLTKLNI